MVLSLPFNFYHIIYSLCLSIKIDEIKKSYLYSTIVFRAISIRVQFLQNTTKYQLYLSISFSSGKLNYNIEALCTITTWKLEKNSQICEHIVRV